jgi:hypothetical protein
MPAPGEAPGEAPVGSAGGKRQGKRQGKRRWETLGGEAPGGTALTVVVRDGAAPTRCFTANDYAASTGLRRRRFYAGSTGAAFPCSFHATSRAVIRFNTPGRIPGYR